MPSPAPSRLLLATTWVKILQHMTLSHFALNRPLWPSRIFGKANMLWTTSDLASCAQMSQSPEVSIPDVGVVVSSGVRYFGNSES